MAQSYGLGRGLSSLIPSKKAPSDDSSPSASRSTPSVSSESSAELSEHGKNITEVSIDAIIVNPHQPRVHFDQEKLEELAASIRQHGIIQPLIVHQHGSSYMLIAGERRLQAAKKAGLSRVPVVVRAEKPQEQEQLELALVENIQRHDLNVVEEARAYQKLSKDFSLSQEEIASRVGKSRSAVANRMRLLSLPVEIQRALMEGVITEGHAKAILGVEGAEKQRVLFSLIVNNKLTVRQAEDKIKTIAVRSHQRTVHRDPETQALEDQLTGVLGTKVKVAHAGNGGKIIINYYSKEDLDALLSKIAPES